MRANRGGCDQPLKRDLPPRQPDVEKALRGQPCAPRRNALALRCAQQPRLSSPQKAIRTEKMLEALQIRLEQEPRYQSAIGMELRRLVLNFVVEIVRDLS